MINKINGRAKGGRGEREFGEWLQKNLDLDFKPTRNLDQVREGGADILTLPPFVFEVKRQEKLALRDWWVQVCKASQGSDVPVVAFRQNKQPWTFLISAKNLGLKSGFVQLIEFEGKNWLQMVLRKYSK